MKKADGSFPVKAENIIVTGGDILPFHPGDNHSCSQEDGEDLDYRGLNISKEVMTTLTIELTGKRELPVFSKNVIKELEAALGNGFSDQSHFTNYFTSFTGIPPGSYREIYRIKEDTKENGTNLKERTE
ncbi:AraC family transcriptional regulator [Blautia sp. An46]|uniref:AraC family transcriptional regulator n=1 Tax=Blautia sp. An46 TaxID=1965636 RepID=UPI000B36B982|nr:helix-turn-helix transcriptional regulator [Blautia sp. An46]OUN90651.1 hypothetical protein B5G00_15165 [Blautia sp. An46]